VDFHCEIKMSQKFHFSWNSQYNILKKSAKSLQKENLICPHPTAQNDNDRQVTVFYIPKHLAQLKGLLVAFSGPERPVEKILLHAKTAVKVTFNHPHEADAVIARGTITIYGRSFIAKRPNNKRKMLCHLCKTLECNQTGCTNLRCGKCAEPHHTKKCTVSGTEMFCVTCNNRGHYYEDCPLQFEAIQ